jgi:hypothetical protein
MARNESWPAIYAYDADRGQSDVHCGPPYTGRREPSSAVQLVLTFQINDAKVFDISNLAARHVAGLAANWAGLGMACQKTRDLIF